MSPLKLICSFGGKLEGMVEILRRHAHDCPPFTLAEIEFTEPCERIIERIVEERDRFVINGAALW